MINGLCQFNKAVSILHHCWR